MSKTLYIDGKDNHSDDDTCLVIHPSHLQSASTLEDNYFDKIIIKNSKVEYLKAANLFHIFRSLKNSGLLEVIIDQPIVVMQSLDASEIEANCRLAGFTDIREESFSLFEKKNGKENKIETLKLSMVKP